MRDFFVSMAGGKRVALLAGPFASLEEALRHVDTARREAQRRDPWAHFYAFGTLSTEPRGKRGVLNPALGL